MAGIYVHFPFCSSRCIYCDFYSQTGTDWKEYVDVLETEAGRRKDFLKGVPPVTIYFGGGTPSLLPQEELSRLTDTLGRHFDLSSVKEFTIEANPDDVTPQKAAAWKEMGATRLSMGVQSFDDDTLKWMKRRHSAEDVVKAFDTARTAGFDNISIDLIFGFDGLSHEQWDKNISCALGLDGEHISCYQMSGRYASADEMLCEKQYLHLQERLMEAGFEQYEVSNYCKAGRQSLHNCGYWRREAYLGLGAAAHSFDGELSRMWNVSDIKAYMEGTEPAGEKLTEEDIFIEKIMLGLRTAEGIESSLVQGRESTGDLLKSGHLISEGGRIRIPSRHLFVSDWIVGKLLGL